MIITIIIGLLSVAGGFVGGVLVGRRNAKKVNAVIADVKAVESHIIMPAANTPVHTVTIVTASAPTVSHVVSTPSAVKKV